MSHHVIHIFGASGSGTTTLARCIAERWGFVHLDSDDFFWLPTDPPYTHKRPIDERVPLMRAQIERAENAVISGSLTDWGDPLIPCFTLAVRLVTPTDVRIARLREREHRHFGARIEPGGDMEEAHQAFLAWAAGYDDGGPDTRSRMKHDEWQKLLRCPLLTLHGDAPLEENLTEIENFLTYSCESGGNSGESSRLLRV